MSPECPGCGKPTQPVFATRQNGGQLRAWYCPACNDWMAPVYRERLWTRDQWDNNDKPYTAGS